jgi:hypothetical protein
VVQTAVDLCAAADAAAFGERDHRPAESDTEPAMSEGTGQLARRQVLVGSRLDPRPLLEDEHVLAGSGEPCGSDRTPGA